MSSQFSFENNPSAEDNYTYLQFIIHETTRQIEVNFIDRASGRVIRHIPPDDLARIVRDYHLLYGPQTQTPGEG